MRIASPFLPAPSSSLVSTELDPVVHTDVRRMQPRRKRECASRLHGLPGQARQCRSEKVLLHRTFPRKRGSGFFLACWVPLPRWQTSAPVLAARLRARAFQILSREARSRGGMRMRGVAPRCLLLLRPFRQAIPLYLVTTGLDPVVHAEMQLGKPFGNSK